MMKNKNQTSVFGIAILLASLAASGSGFAASTENTESVDSQVQASESSTQKAHRLLSEGRALYAADNLFEAMPLLEEAAALGLAEAQSFWAYVLYQSGGYEDAVRLYSLAADQGDLVAKLRLAEFHLLGTHLAKDVEKSVALLKECVARDFTPAMIVLAEIYADGREGVSLDTEQALTLYQSAGELLDINALTKLENIYRDGLLGQTPDPLKVEYWINKKRSIPAAPQETN
jgi:TPR repeat protein